MTSNHFKRIVNNPSGSRLVYKVFLMSFNQNCCLSLDPVRGRLKDFPFFGQTGIIACMGGLVFAKPCSALHGGKFRNLLPFWKNEVNGLSSHTVCVQTLKRIVWWEKRRLWIRHQLFGAIFYHYHYYQRIQGELSWDVGHNHLILLFPSLAPNNDDVIYRNFLTQLIV